MDTDFAEWIIEELQARNMTQADLARASGLGTGSTSDVLSRKKKAGKNFAIAIAKGFELPAETVFQEAGFLPKDKEKHNREIEQIITIVEGMPLEEQKEILSYIRWKNNQKKR
jgi:transcriptional regulator with XRE-family HTH domain